jgi:hypothetical protein
MKPAILHCEADVELTAAAKRYACTRPELTGTFSAPFALRRMLLKSSQIGFRFWKSQFAECVFLDFRIESFTKKWMIVCKFLLSCTTAANRVTGKAD